MWCLFYSDKKLDAVTWSRRKTASPPFSFPASTSGPESWQPVLFLMCSKSSLAENSIIVMKI